MASKIFHTKDWSFGIQFETFDKSKKDIKVYQNGFHHWMDSFGVHFFAMVIHRLRIIVFKKDKYHGTRISNEVANRKAE